MVLDVADRVDGGVLTDRGLHGDVERALPRLQPPEAPAGQRPIAAAELDLPLHRLLYARAADVLSLAALLDGPEEGIVDSAARRAAS